MSLRLLLDMPGASTGTQASTFRMKYGAATRHVPLLIMGKGVLRLRIESYTFLGILVLLFHQRDTSVGMNSIGTTPIKLLYMPIIINILGVGYLVLV